MVEATAEDEHHTDRVYYENSYICNIIDAKVKYVGAGPEAIKEDQQIVILDKTIFHPQGGGQPADHGFLRQGETKFIIEDCLSRNGQKTVVHIGKFVPAGATFEVGSHVDCHVDEIKRRLHARIHSAGHLLDMAMRANGREDLKPGKGYHHPTGAYVEYIGAVENEEKPALIEKLNQTCQDIIKETPEETKVFKKVLSYDEANSALAKCGGVPSYIPEGQALRVLKLNDEDYGCPCGGTHVEHVSDIIEMTVTNIKKKGKNVQVKYEVKQISEASHDHDHNPLATAIKGD